MVPPRASEVPRERAARRGRPTAAALPGRQLLPARSSRAAREADLEVAQEPGLGGVARLGRRLAAALAAQPEPPRELGKPAARRRRARRAVGAGRAGVDAPLRALHLGE